LLIIADKLTDYAFVRRLRDIRWATVELARDRTRLGGEGFVGLDDVESPY
jgi:hypothetical protein